MTFSPLDPLRRAATSWLTGSSTKAGTQQSRLVLLPKSEKR
jgi:hypothetical protein